MNDGVWVIVPAGGSGLRASLAVPKQFLVLGGVTVLERTVSNIVATQGIEGVVVVLPEKEGVDKRGAHGAQVDSARYRLSRLATPEVPVVFAEGGATRQESVRLGLRKVPREAPWIAVHDASRPFADPALFSEVCREAKRVGAAICGIPVKDTVKTGICTEDGTLRVESTLDRSALVCVQTPQVFRADLLRRAHERALEQGVSGTDDSGLVEMLGHEVAIVPGARTNVKLTYPEDFLFGSALLGETPSIGFGFDVHPLVLNRPCVIGGVDIPFERGLSGHSDADVLCHAVMDSILGALCQGDIGQRFPDTDPKYQNASSMVLLRQMWEELGSRAEIVNIDATVLAEVPKIASYVREMRLNFAKALGICFGRISVKATTTEKLGFLGRGEGIAATSVCMVKRWNT